MSAFQVNDELINAILQGVYGRNYEGFNIWQFQNDPKAYHFKPGLKETVQSEADCLMAENIRSVEHCYPEHEKQAVAWKVKIKFDTNPMSPLGVLKLIDCLEYQSCECEDYESTEAYKLICKYRKIMIRQVHGYNDEKWSI